MIRDRLVPGVFLRTGHRGARGLAPENTLAAFERGAAEGLDVLELDVQLTKDGEVVVIHDPSVARTTDWSGPGQGLVDELSWDELRRLDAGHAFTPDEGASFPFRGRAVRIPRLREVLEAFPRLLFTIELKASPRRDQLVERVAAVVGPHADRVIVASFQHDHLVALRRAAPELVTSFSSKEIRDFYLLSRVGRAGLFFRSPAKVIQMPRWSDHDHDRGLNLLYPGFVRAAHASGRVIHVWTINDPEVMREVIAAGADGITTDRPDVLAQVLNGP